MKKTYFIFLTLLSIYSGLSAQIKLSEFSEVSIVTAGPGDEFYEAFGHSAIRIKDPVLNFDLIYNYGIFDFNQPNFYSNFAKGNMIYSLARYNFNYFLASYKNHKRWLKQQVLNLTQVEKQAYFNFLENNALVENKNYKYDPYFNNCATILRDLTKSILGNKIVFNSKTPTEVSSLRQLTNHEIHWNSWGSFGLNLITGTRLDTKSSYDEHMFLPDYVYSSFKNATLFVENQPKDFVLREDTLLSFEEKEHTASILNPFLLSSILALLGIFITYKDFKTKKRTRFLDFILFFVTGIFGAILVFLWFFSSHSTAPNNLNILWAFAINIIISFFMLKTQLPRWLNKYLFLLMLFLIVIAILWLMKFQVFPIPILPLMVLLFIRYFFLSKLLTSVK